MFLLINAFYESGRALKSMPVKSITYLRKGLHMGTLFICMSSVAACSGVPLVPGI